MEDKHTRSSMGPTILTTAVWIRGIKVTFDTYCLIAYLTSEVACSGSTVGGSCKVPEMGRHGSNDGRAMREEVKDDQWG